MPFCVNCGTKLEENTSFCPNCGQAVQATPAATPAPSSGEDIEVLVKGILSLALCEFGIPGIVLGALARKGAAKWLASGRPINGKIKTGRILGKFGFILGILMTAFWVIYALILILLVLLQVNTYHSFYF